MSKISLNLIKKILAFVLILSMVSGPEVSYAQGFSMANLPEPGNMVSDSPAFVPVLVKGLIIHPDKPLNFDFLVDSGNDSPDQTIIQNESERMVRYFLAALTVPADQLWVNLSPYEKDRMVADDLGATDLGRDMLAQDYVLKQLTASLIYPEKELGKEFWARIYKEAQEKFGTTDLPVDTFNKVWIVPERAEVFENGGAVYVTGAKLKVMLDSDYLAQSRHAEASREMLSAFPGLKPPKSRSDFRGQRAEASPVLIGHKQNNAGDPSLPSGLPGLSGGSGQDRQDDVSFSSSQDLSKQLIREIILPAIEREVNTGKNFAPLRQIYYAAILAKWYRESIVNTLLDKVYVGKNKIAGVDVADKTVKEQIYQRYIKAYKKGVFNYIKEETNSLTGDTVPRKYFSGGISDFAMRNIKLDRTRDSAAVTGVGKTFKVDFAMGLKRPSGATPVNPLAPLMGYDGELRAFIEDILTQRYTGWGLPNDLAKGIIAALVAERDDPARARQNVYNTVINFGTDAGWKEAYNRYHDLTKYDTTYQQIRSRIKDLAPGAVVLDWGAGENTLGKEIVKNLPGVRVKGIDIYDYHEDTPGVEFFRQDDPVKAPKEIAEHSVDVIVTNAVWHHIADDLVDDVLQEMLRVLKPGGRLIVVEDTYSVNYPYLVDGEKTDAEMTERFLGLVRKYGEQFAKDYFTFNDWQSNILTHSWDGMAMPYEFKSIEGWESRFKGKGFNPVSAEHFGFPPQSKSFHKPDIGVIEFVTSDTALFLGRDRSAALAQNAKYGLPPDAAMLDIVTVGAVIAGAGLWYRLFKKAEAVERVPTREELKTVEDLLKQQVPEGWYPSEVEKFLPEAWAIYIRGGRFRVEDRTTQVYKLRRDSDGVYRPTTTVPLDVENGLVLSEYQQGTTSDAAMSSSEDERTAVAEKVYQRFHINDAKAKSYFIPALVELGKPEENRDVPRLRLAVQGLLGWNLMTAGEISPLVDYILLRAVLSDRDVLWILVADMLRGDKPSGYKAAVRAASWLSHMESSVEYVAVQIKAVRHLAGLVLGKFQAAGLVQHPDLERALGKAYSIVFKSGQNFRILSDHGRLDVESVVGSAFPSYMTLLQFDPEGLAEEVDAAMISDDLLRRAREDLTSFGIADQTAIQFYAEALDRLNKSNLSGAALSIQQFAQRIIKIQPRLSNEALESAIRKLAEEIRYPSDRTAKLITDALRESVPAPVTSQAAGFGDYWASESEIASLKARIGRLADIKDSKVREQEVQTEAERLWGLQGIRSSNAHALFIAAFVELVSGSPQNFQNMRKALIEQNFEAKDSLKSLISSLSAVPLSDEEKLQILVGELMKVDDVTAAWLAAMAIRGMTATTDIERAVQEAVNKVFDTFPSAYKERAGYKASLAKALSSVLRDGKDFKAYLFNNEVGVERVRETENPRPWKTYRELLSDKAMADPAMLSVWAANLPDPAALLAFLQSADQQRIPPAVVLFGTSVTFVTAMAYISSLWKKKKIKSSLEKLRNEGADLESRVEAAAYLTDVLAADKKRFLATRNAHEKDEYERELRNILWNLHLAGVNDTDYQVLRECIFGLAYFMEIVIVRVWLREIAERYKTAGQGINLQDAILKLKLLSDLEHDLDLLDREWPGGAPPDNAMTFLNVSLATTPGSTDLAMLDVNNLTVASWLPVGTLALMISAYVMTRFNEGGVLIRDEADIADRVNRQGQTVVIGQRGFLEPEGNFRYLFDAALELLRNVTQEEILVAYQVKLAALEQWKNGKEVVLTAPPIKGVKGEASLEILQPVDSAMNPGGIDINNIEVSKQNAGAGIRFDDRAVEEILQGGFDGFAPVIINITPIESPLPLLGVRQEAATVAEM